MIAETFFEQQSVDESLVDISIERGPKMHASEFERSDSNIDMCSSLRPAVYDQDLRSGPPPNSMKLLKAALRSLQPTCVAIAVMLKRVIRNDVQCHLQTS